MRISGLQNSTNTGYNIGLAQVLEDVKIGQLTGGIDVTITQATTNPSLKLIATHKMKLDESSVWEYDPDDSGECTDTQRARGNAVADLGNLGPTSALYPLTCSQNCLMMGTSSQIFYSTICSASTYFKLKEESQQLSVGGLIGQAGGFYATVGGVFAMINSKTWSLVNPEDSAVVTPVSVFGVATE